MANFKVIITTKGGNKVETSMQAFNLNGIIDQLDGNHGFVISSDCSGHKVVPKASIDMFTAQEVGY